MTRQANVLLIVLVSFLLAYWLRFGYTSLPESYLVALLLTLIVSSIVFPATGAFRREFEWAFMRKLRRLIAGWAVVLLTLVSIAAMLKTTDSYSRIWFGLWALISTFGLVVVVLVTHAANIRKRNRMRKTRPVVLVGSGEAAVRLENRILTDPASDMKLVARFGQPWSEDPVRPVSELAGFISENHIKSVWIAVPWEEKQLLEQSLSELKELVVDVNVVPDFHQYRLLNQSISEWSGLPVISLAGTPMTGAELGLKVVMDRVGALLLILALSPLLLLIALIIWFY